MTYFDFNSASEQTSFDLIPKGTLVRVRMTIKPGGFDDPSQGWTGGYASVFTEGLAMAKWTIDDVALRLSQAADVARRLPAVRVQGYFNCWPAIKRAEHENLGVEDRPPVYFPPSPESVDRMLEVMRWVLWLEEEQRHLVWMRAKRYGWREIGIRFACDRSTAWRRWQMALAKVALHLNLEDRS